MIVTGGAEWLYYLGAALGLETESLTGKQVNWESTARILFI